MAKRHVLTRMAKLLFGVVMRVTVSQYNIQDKSRDSSLKKEIKMWVTGKG